RTGDAARSSLGPALRARERAQARRPPAAGGIRGWPLVGAVVRRLEPAVGPRLRRRADRDRRTAGRATANLAPARRMATGRVARRRRRARNRLSAFVQPPTSNTAISGRHRKRAGKIEVPTPRLT